MTHYTADTLTDYLHGELEPALDAAVAAHLLTCTDCTARYDAEARLGEMLRSAARAEERELPGMVRAKIWDAVRHERPSFWERVRRWGPIAAVPAAAAVALAAYIGVPVVRGPGGTVPAAITASYYLDEHRAETQMNPLADHGGLIVPASAPNNAPGGPLIDAADAATLGDRGATN